MISVAAMTEANVLVAFISHRFALEYENERHIDIYNGESDVISTTTAQLRNQTS